MDVFTTPEFIAAYAVRGGSPFECLSPAQQTALSSSFYRSVSSIPSHPGHHENDSRTNGEIKHLNDFIVELVDLIVRSSFSLPFLYAKFCLLFRSLLVFPVQCFTTPSLGMPPFVNSLASTISLAPKPVLDS